MGGTPLVRCPIIGDVLICKVSPYLEVSSCVMCSMWMCPLMKAYSWEVSSHKVSLYGKSLLSGGVPLW